MLAFLRVRSVAWALLPVVLFMARSRAFCQAEDRSRELPKDGAWVRHQWTYEVDGKKEGEGTVTLSLVGTVVEDGVTCRWLEMKMSIQEPAKSAGTTMSKILIPEDDLRSSEKPLENFHRRWAQGRGKSVKKKEIIENPAFFEERLLWTSGMLKDSKPAVDETKDIQFQTGQFKDAHARTGQRVYKADGDAQAHTITYTVWQHPDLSIGFAEARIESRFLRGDMKPGKPFATVYRIQDFGSDAKSELPENN